MGNKINVYYLSLKLETPANDYWDYGLLNDFLQGELWCSPDFPEFTLQEVGRLETSDKAIVVLPARHHAGLETQVNSELQKVKHVVLFLMGDEEADFQPELITHKSIHIWVQNPHPGRHDSYNKLGTTYPPQLKNYVKKLDKDITVFFSGQITHKRRNEMSDSVMEMEYIDKSIVINRTQGFTQGFDHKTYYEYMSRAKIVPCPSGAVIPDSFRVYESLECMAIPIADEVNPTGTINGYWEWLMGSVPFPLIKEWTSLAGYTEDVLHDYSANLHRQTAWWILWKRNFAKKVVAQINA